MGIVEDVKNVAKLVQQIDNVELYKKILDLQGEAMELVEENRQLKTKLREIEEDARREKSLLHRHDCYWETRDSGESGPFCTRCWDVERKLVRLTDYDNGFSGCHNCKLTVTNRWTGVSRDGYG